MNIIALAQQFVQRLLYPADPRCCPRCHKAMGKKNGTRWVTIRDLDGQGAHRERHQNWWCHLCRRSYYVADPRRRKYARYTRQVQRKSLDMYVHVGGSLRHVADDLRAEVNDTGRAYIWNPLRRLKPPPERLAKLSHTTIWRWEQQAGQQALHYRQARLWHDVVPFSGALVADATGISVRGINMSLHWVGEAVSGLSLRWQRLNQESDLVIRGQFRAALETWGWQPTQVQYLVSDGANAYHSVLEHLLRQAHHQRCVFHLWRNILPTILVYRHQAGWPVARELTVALAKVWNATHLEQAQRFLTKVQYKWRDFSLLHPLFALIARTLPEAMTHTSCPGDSLGCTSNLAERFVRRYKQRTRRMGCFMSTQGADHFNALWEIYANFEQLQIRREHKKRYRHSGQSPLEVAQADFHDLTWLDVIGL